MEVAGVKIFPIRDSRVKAYIAIVLDDCFMVMDLKASVLNA